MEINADFTRSALVHSESEPWVPSPMPGVERRMLDRLGDEVARATSIVRYAPGSAFSPHTHGGGEEFVVLDGVFEDEYGSFPAGTYMAPRNGGFMEGALEQAEAVARALLGVSPDNGAPPDQNIY